MFASAASRSMSLTTFGKMQMEKERKSRFFATSGKKKKRKLNGEGEKAS